MEQNIREIILQRKSTNKTPLLPIKGAIFDLDGVLTDTSELHYQAWDKLAKEENIPFTREDNESLRGISRRKSLELILKGKKISEREIEEMMDRKNQYYIKSISLLTDKNLLPGVRDFLKDLRSNGIKTAVGSSSKNAFTVIEKLGINDLFDAIVDGSSVTHPKPEPDLFLLAAKLINVPPSQCAVFEDATAGIDAAIVGGMWAIGIGPESRFENAHIVFQNLRDLSEKKISQLLTRVT